MKEDWFFSYFIRWYNMNQSFSEMWSLASIYSNTLWKIMLWIILPRGINLELLRKVFISTCIPYESCVILYNRMLISLSSTFVFKTRKHKKDALCSQCWIFTSSHDHTFNPLKVGFDTNHENRENTRESWIVFLSSFKTFTRESCIQESNPYWSYICNLTMQE